MGLSTMLRCGREPIPSCAAENLNIRPPRGVQTVYLKPLKRPSTYHVPSCDIQLRSYSVRNLEIFADFAIRAAYYAGLGISGPVSLPQVVERWTVPRGNFVHKKSQENFERTTFRRLLQIEDGHQENVKIWLTFLNMHVYHGIGMKVNIWTYEDMGASNIVAVFFVY